MQIKVKLQTYQQKPLIIAPDFCPYAVVEIDTEQEKEIKIVSPQLCILCKKCEFISDVVSEGASSEELTRITKFFIEFNTKIANSISGQQFFLSKENRIPLVILISPILLDQCLQYACNNNSERIEELKNYIISHEIPICFILGCPVYLSRKLTKTPIMVVGEIIWK
jgi:ferredoxin